MDKRNQDKIRVYRKHKTLDKYWSVTDKKYVSRKDIPQGALVLDHTGREIKF